MLVMVLILAGCGRPLQLGTPNQTQLQPTHLLSDTTLPTIPATSVPSMAPPAPATSELDATALVEPTLEATPPATLEAESTPAAGPTATLMPAVIVIPLTQLPETNQERWRAQQQDRKVNDPARIYIAKSPATLWWYDPLTSQSVPIGTISGEFPAQAEFTLRNVQQAALEVPYRINNDFGLTAISEAVRERMKAAGYTESVEAYVLHTDATQPK